MGVEIERKFLIKDDSWRAEVVKSTRYRQGYLTSVETCSIRVRIAGDKATINIKSATLGVTRTEYEYPIPIEEAEEILDHLCTKPLIEKTRHIVEHDGHTWEIDVFEDDNDGLVVAEIELDQADQDFTLPGWTGKEVSDDPRYYNVCLVKHPYKDW